MLVSNQVIEIVRIPHDAMEVERHLPQVQASQIENGLKLIIEQFTRPKSPPERAGLEP